MTLGLQPARDFQSRGWNSVLRAHSGTEGPAQAKAYATVVKLELAGSSRNGRRTNTGGGFETPGVRRLSTKSDVPRFRSDHRR